jgi:transcription antitermination factor NusG
VNTGNVIPTQDAIAPAGLPFQHDVQTGSWYAVQTRSRHERVAAYQFKTRGIVQYCPTVVETHRWSDRHRKIEIPLFPGYIFVRIAASNECRLAVLRTHGVLRIVGSAPLGTPIPDEQIDSVRALLACNLPWTFHPFLKEGQRVRIRGGALDGVEGVFVKRAGLDTLIISVEVVQRSLSISVQGYDLEPL